MLILLIVTRMLGEEQAGAFEFHFSNARLLLTIGYFETRSFQISDHQNSYSFPHYLVFKVITCTMMFGTALLFVGIKGYDLLKASVLLLLVLLKMFDAISDVFEGLYQSKNRMDLSGVSSAIKTVLSIGMFAVVLYLTRSLSISIVVGTFMQFLVVVVLDLPLAKRFAEVKLIWDRKKVIRLFQECLPIFLSAFLSLYLFNIPKYVMDGGFSDEYQTYYSILFFPTTMINLLRTFTFKPIMSKFALTWSEKKMEEFGGIMKQQILIIIGIMTAALMFGYVLGIPVLSLLYGINLYDYKMELMILLMGGGLSALSLMFHYVLVLMRKQTLLFVIYLFTAAIVTIVSPYMAAYGGFLWVAMSFLLAMIILSGLLLGATVWLMLRERRKQ